jgi:hypothetical protein
LLSLGQTIADQTAAPVYFSQTLPEGNAAPLHDTLGRNARLFAELVDRHLKDGAVMKNGILTFVGYSRGGLDAVTAAQKFIAAGMPADQLRFVFVATPFDGAPLAKIDQRPATEEMHSGSETLRDITTQLRQLLATGAQAQFLTFPYDSVVPSTRAHLPEYPLWQIDGVEGHLSITDTRTMQVLGDVVTHMQQEADRHHVDALPLAA